MFISPLLFTNIPKKYSLTHLHKKWIEINKKDTKMYPYTVVNVIILLFYSSVKTNESLNSKKALQISSYVWQPPKIESIISKPPLT